MILNINSQARTIIIFQLEIIICQSETGTLTLQKPTITLSNMSNLGTCLATSGVNSLAASTHLTMSCPLRTTGEATYVMFKLFVIERYGILCLLFSPRFNNFSILNLNKRQFIIIYSIKRVEFKVNHTLVSKKVKKGNSSSYSL